MILRRLRVHPFGRFADREVPFAASLTVVLGPNEAGKSTLLEALKAALFVPTKLSKPKFQEYLARYVPVDGGDVVRTEIAFAAESGEYVLIKRWGTTPGTELRQPRGGPLADETAVRERVAALLPATPKTVVSVLLIGQSELGRTVETIAGDRSALDDVASLLRRVVQETGGVSVEQVRRRLAETAAALYGRWDRERGAPEKNRGIENPWDRGVGEVLAAWYAAERLRVELERARAYERDMDELNRRIEEAEAELRGHDTFLEGNAAASRDAAERRMLEAELALEAEKRVRLARDADEWPVREAKEKELAGLIAEAEARLPMLTAEQQAADVEQRNLALRAQELRVRARKARLADVEAARATAPELGRPALEEIQAAASEADRRRAAAETGRLSLRLAARRAAAIELRKDGEPASTVELRAGESRTLDAGSAFSLHLPDLDIAVGQGGASRADPAEALRRLAVLLAAHGLADATEAEARFRRHEELSADLERARRDLAEELAGESLAAFEARAAALGPVRETRPVGEVARELAGAEAALGAWKKEQRECRARMEELAAAYGAREKLHAALGASAHRSDGLAAKIAACAPLPAGFADAAVFLAEYERAKTVRERVKDAMNELLRERAGREAVAPEQTGDEIEDQLGDARARFEAALARAKAVDRVIAAVDRVAGSDDGVYAGLADEVARRFAGLSLGEHPGVMMRGGVPSAVKTASGADLPLEWLSAGAKDLLGLAVRLAMAGVVIGDSGGFLVMDDPLVDLDPERQAAAAAAIREFASRRQTIVFTCHPAHAELLGGERVRLA
jgi:exonuclease SbcC